MEKDKLVTKHRTKNEFTGSYKNCEIVITKEKNDDWYILVWGEDGGHLYDGWWTHSSNASMDEALKEAINGAEL